MRALIRLAEPFTHPAPHSIHLSEDGHETRELSFLQTVSHYAVNAIALLGALLVLPFAVVGSLGHRVYTWILGPPISAHLEDGKEGSSALLQLSDVLPKHFGPAMSVFQTTGVNTESSANPDFLGPNQWNGHLKNGKIDGIEHPDELKGLFIDIFRPENATKYSDLLHSMGCTALRFSLEWAMFQENSLEFFNQNAIDAYRIFIRELKKNNIEPFVTIHHFTHPLWFEELGAFTKKENIKLFTDYALEMIEAFPEVKYWYTFNEVGAFTLEGWLQDHPSPIRGLHDAGLTIRNMLMGHCIVYEEAKKKNRETRIGITHQWLKLHPINPGNFLEELVCHVASKVAHLAVHEFFKTGNFVFRTSFFSNLSFHIDPEIFKANNKFLDHIGLQFYGPAHIILGSNGGSHYPGHRISNFVIQLLGMGVSFGGTSVFGKPVMSFGPTVDPDALEPNILEAIELGKEIHITEIGVDAMIQKHGEEEFREDREFQKEIFETYVPILARYKDDIQALFVWSIHCKLEWNRGPEPLLNIGKFLTDNKGTITDLQLFSAGEWFKEQFLAKREFEKSDKGKDEEKE